ncbi:hypothetical protein Syun_007280 [Stephania yunnanensis]|uniref:Uncharacterized protein n=1 Tax=Stephania yunnanensis TaxID=152371 RepID=A0AAP0KZY6_9MAGN
MLTLLLIMVSTSSIDFPVSVPMFHVPKRIFFSPLYLFFFSISILSKRSSVRIYDFVFVFVFVLN